MNKQFVFVYGSLMKGFQNEIILRGLVDNREHAVTELPMTLFNICGSFPALVQGCCHGKPKRIHGELLSIKPGKVYDECISRLDRLEGYRPDNPEASLYTRKTVSVVTDDGSTHEAIVYLMDVDRAEFVHGTVTDLDDWHKYFKHSAK